MIAKSDDKEIAPSNVASSVKKSLAEGSLWLSPEVYRGMAVNNQCSRGSSKREKTQSCKKSGFSCYSQQKNSEKNTCRQGGWKNPNQSTESCPANTRNCFTSKQQRHASTVDSQNPQYNSGEVKRVTCLDVGASQRKVSSSLCWEVIVCGVQCQFEVDIGSGETLMSLQEYHQRIRRQGVRLEKAGAGSVTTFTGMRVKPCGKLTASISIMGEFYGNLEVIVVNTGSRFTPIVGRSWLDIVNPNWRSLLKP